MTIFIWKDASRGRKIRILAALAGIVLTSMLISAGIVILVMTRDYDLMWLALFTGLFVHVLNKYWIRSPAAPRFLELMLYGGMCLMFIARHIASLQ